MGYWWFSAVEPAVSSCDRKCVVISTFTSVCLVVVLACGAVAGTWPRSVGAPFKGRTGWNHRACSTKSTSSLRKSARRSQVQQSVSQRTIEPAGPDQIHHARHGRPGPQLQRRVCGGIPANRRPARPSAMFLPQRRQAGSSNPNYSHTREASQKGTDLANSLTRKAVKNRRDSPLAFAARSTFPCFANSYRPWHTADKKTAVHKRAKTPPQD